MAERMIKKASKVPSEYWQGEWPNLSSISISIGVSEFLSPSELGVLYRLIWNLAAQSVHSQFSEPHPDPGLPLDEAKLMRLACCDEAEWANCRGSVISYFEIRGGKYRLINPALIRIINGHGRNGIPASVRDAVSERDGHRCVYCGDETGPFHLDHIWPVVRGGSDDVNNLALACAPCNLSKGSKTLVEWMASK